jgi:cytochrome P450
MTPRTDTNFHTQPTIADPYSIYEELRSLGSVVWNDAMQGWNVLGFDEVSEVLTDAGERFTMLSSHLAYWFEAPNLITVDGPYQRRLRGALSPYFTRSAIAKWEQRVREVVEELVAPLREGKRSYDLIADFTMIPTVIVADMLGVRSERYEDFQRWSHAIVSNLAWGAESEEIQAIMRRAATEINEYIREEMERHRSERPNDLFTAMLDFSGEKEMTDEEIRSTAVLLVIAGYDTTAKTMGNSLVALEAHPDQRRQVAENPELLAAAIEEAMRWSGPVQYTSPRLTIQGTELGGVKISEGDTVYVFLAAANRDPKRWKAPDRFDIHRESRSHVAFGLGPHLCLGAPLARLETKVAIEYLLKIAPEYTLRDVDLGNSFFMRGPERGFIETGALGNVSAGPAKDQNGVGG